MQISRGDAVYLLRSMYFYMDKLSNTLESARDSDDYWHVMDLRDRLADELKREAFIDVEERV